MSFYYHFFFTFQNAGGQNIMPIDFTIYVDKYLDIEDNFTSVFIKVALKFSSFSDNLNDFQMHLILA